MVNSLRYMEERDFKKDFDFKDSRSFWVPGLGIEDCHEIDTSRLVQNRTFMAEIFKNAPANTNRWRFSTYYGQAWLEYGQVRVEYYRVQGKASIRDFTNKPINN